MPNQKGELENVEVTQIIPQECVQQQTEDVMVHVPVPRGVKENSQMVQFSLQTWISERTVEQVVSVSVPQHLALSTRLTWTRTCCRRGSSRDLVNRS